MLIAINYIPIYRIWVPPALQLSFLVYLPVKNIGNIMNSLRDITNYSRNVIIFTINSKFHFIHYEMLHELCFLYGLLFSNIIFIIPYYDRISSLFNLKYENLWQFSDINIFNSLMFILLSHIQSMMYFRILWCQRLDTLPEVMTILFFNQIPNVP
jgi:hypothetical protein